MKTCDITRQLIEEIAEQKNRTKAIQTAGISKREFYLYANHYGVPFRRGNSPYKLTHDDRVLIARLANESNLTYREIGEKFEVSHTTVRRCVQSYA